MNLTKNISVCVFILTVYTLYGSSVVSGLRPPSPVRLTSYNMDLVLRWDPPEGEAGDLSYTAQYKPILQYSAADWRPVCVKTSIQECDLQSNPSFSIFAYAMYVGRVSTERGEERSEWTESNNLTLDRQTIIGPPNITLHSYRGDIEVSITDPEFSIKSLRDVYSSHSYNITYWRDGQKEKAKYRTAIQQNLVVLDELDPWTKYCVQVQILTSMNLNPSKASSIVCMSTTNRDEAPWVVAVVIFLFMAMVITLVVLTVVYRKKISNFLCLKVSLPHSFEHLQALPNSPMYFAMSDSQISKEVCDPVCVVTQHGTPVEEQPLQADRTVQEEQHLQGDHQGAEQEPSVQVDRTAEEELFLTAAQSSCSTECDVTEEEGQKEETP
ncbi:interleukin-10 receptor subunit beta-like isoform X1 [Halichoeres trimaculatus]|uniref:interleukin-10 receptor subunit beta-like isoform X1 n=1 Tax=Halichoeres trimaculatus TaxID=147232 RepID=UPI003D9E1176